LSLLETGNPLFEMCCRACTTTIQATAPTCRNLNVNGVHRVTTLLATVISTTSAVTQKNKKKTPGSILLLIYKKTGNGKTPPQWIKNWKFKLKQEEGLRKRQKAGGCAFSAATLKRRQAQFGPPSVERSIF